MKPKNISNVHKRLVMQIIWELSTDTTSSLTGLNEELVQMLLKRDDCHMEQDSMLVDIEDLTRYL